MTISEINEARKILTECWGVDKADEIFAMCYTTTKFPMTVDKFTTFCVSCGGDLNNMLLSGVRKLYPEIYTAVPDKLGKNSSEAFASVCNLLILLGVITK